jgi:hypothetical protein
LSSINIKRAVENIRSGTTVYTPVVELIDAVFAEPDGTSDRAVILVADSLLDHALSGAIMSRLREPPTDEGWQELFVLWLGMFIAKLSGRHRRLT